MSTETIVPPCRYTHFAWRLHALPMHMQDDLVDELRLTETDTAALRSIQRGQGGTIRSDIWPALEKALASFEQEWTDHI